jgi:hypothetical protein
MKTSFRSPPAPSLSSRCCRLQPWRNRANPIRECKAAPSRRSRISNSRTSRPDAGWVWRLPRNSMAIQAPVIFSNYPKTRTHVKSAVRFKGDVRRHESRDDSDRGKSDRAGKTIGSSVYRKDRFRGAIERRDQGYRRNAGSSPKCPSQIPSAGSCDPSAFPNTPVCRTERIWGRASGTNAPQAPL